MDHEIYRTNLEDLVNNPRETLSIELKGWHDIKSKTPEATLARAKIAKHIAALANYGGGYIVFGFSDNEAAAPNRPIDISNYNRDAFSSIANKYLTPSLQCEVVHVTSKDGLEYPIVRVPSHKNTPICAKASGPQDEKGKIQGIQAGAYYIRKVGPESEALSGVEEWQPLIRRCVLFDRNELLSELASVIEPHKRSEPQKSTADKLEHWHKTTAALWRSQAKESSVQWPISIEDNHVQFSYLISSENGVGIPDKDLKQALEQANHRVMQTVWTGWSMFYPFALPEIAPRIHPENEDGTGPSVLVTNLLNDRYFDSSLPDYWRYSVDGRASILRPFREDRQRTVKSTGRSAGTWLSPETVIRETAEVVAHARTMTERFGGEAVSFRCTWQGLSGREIDDFDGLYWSPGRICQANLRTTEGTWEIAALTATWHQVVAALSCPILSLFGFGDCSADLVKGLAPRFIKL